MVNGDVDLASLLTRRYTETFAAEDRAAPKRIRKSARPGKGHQRFPFAWGRRALGRIDCREL
jgi:hypothetical protein